MGGIGMMGCDGWWLRTALHRLACLPPVRPGHTPLAALAPLSLGERGKEGAKRPLSFGHFRRGAGETRIG